MMDGNNNKIDVRLKPILSPTRSLDEGFESDPERASSSAASDTEQQITSTNSKNQQQQQPSFDVLQRTDRDGVQHTQISRRQKFLSNEQLSGPASIICLQGEIDTETNRSTNSSAEHKVSIPRAGIPQQQQQQQLSSVINSNNNNNINDRYRLDSRTKKIPTLPRTTTGGSNGRRSHSVEPIIRRNDLTTPTSTSSLMSSVPFIKYGRHQQNNNNNLLKHNNNISNNNNMPNNMLCQANSLYTFYPAEGNISLYASHYGLTYKSSHMNVQSKAPISWTQSIPRHTRR